MINDLDNLTDLTDLEDKNNCVICFNVIDEQITFKCGHYFCKKCVDDWISKNIENIINNNNSGRNIMNCFLCRGNIKKLSYKNNDIKIRNYINKIIINNNNNNNNNNTESNTSNNDIESNTSNNDIESNTSNNDIESNTSNNDIESNTSNNNNNNNFNYLDNRKYVEYGCILLTVSGSIFSFLYYLENYKRY